MTKEVEILRNGIKRALLEIEYNPVKVLNDTLKKADKVRDDDN